MTYLNTQQTLQFVQRYDRNGDGLSKQELMQGAMKSCMQMMHSMASGNQQGVMEAFQNLSTATQLAQGFDVMAQASGKFMPDNANTISGLDILKTAMNDGNMGNITNYDLGSQNIQNQYGNFFPGRNPDMCYGNFGGMPETGGIAGGYNLPGANQSSMFNMNMMQPTQGFNNSYYNQLSGSEFGQQAESTSGKGALGGILAGGALALATGGAALPFMAVGALVGSGVAGKVLQGAGNFQQMIGQGMKSLGNLVEMPFQKVGDVLGKIPLVGGLLKGVTNIAGKLTSAPLKIAGAITEIGGKIVSGIGKAVDKVGSFLKKL